MSIIASIRKKSFLLILLVGFSLLAFVISDFLNSGSSFLEGDKNNVGNINGQGISYIEFESKIQSRISYYKQQYKFANLPSSMLFRINNEIWNEVVMNRVYDELSQDMGIKVSSAELWQEILKIPMIENNFTNKNTGTVDQEQVKQYVSYIRRNSTSDEEAARSWNQWRGIEEELKVSTLKKKVDQTFSSLFLPSTIEVMTKSKFSEERFTMEYTGIKFDDLTDSVYIPTQQEIKDEMLKEKKKYTRKPSRTVQIVYKNVLPSLEDLDNLKAELTDLIEDKLIYDIEQKKEIVSPGFKNTEEPAIFVTENSDKAYTELYYHADKLNEDLKAFVEKAKEGDVYGPYKNETTKTFDLVKLLKIKNLPDSVLTSHVLISYNTIDKKATLSKSEAKELADSLYSVVKDKKTPFDSIVKYSNDPSSKSLNGSLGWLKINNTLKQIQDFVFENKPNNIKLIESPYGYHIVRIDKKSPARKTFQITFINRQIEASSETYDEAYQKIRSISNGNLSANEFALTAIEKDLQTERVDHLLEMDPSVGNLMDSRDIVRWAFEEEIKAGDIKIFEKTNLIVSALVESIHPEGLMSTKEVSDELITKISNRKKVKDLKSKLETVSSKDNLKIIAEEIGKEVHKTSSISIENPILLGVGRDAKLVSSSLALEANQVKGPIVGDRGVFYVNVLEKSEIDTTSNQNAVKQEIFNSLLQKNYETRIPKFIQSYKENMDIEDNRKIFY